MIQNEEQLQRTRSALEKLERAMAALQSQQSTLHPDRYALMAAPILDDVRRLRHEIDDYIGVTVAAKASE